MLHVLWFNGSWFCGLWFNLEVPCRYDSIDYSSTWFSGSMVRKNHSSMVLMFYSSLVSWFHDSMFASRGSMVLWFCCSIALWFHSTVVLWFCDSVAQWFYGSMVLWFCGFVVLVCFRGSMDDGSDVLRTRGSMTLYSKTKYNIARLHRVYRYCCSLFSKQDISTK